MEISSLKRGPSFLDHERFKALRSCSSFNSNQRVFREIGFPWLMLFLDDGDCVLYNPNEDKIERDLRDFSGSRFVANSGTWFLVVDSGLNLYVKDLLGGNRIDLPPLESISTSDYKLKRIGDEQYRWELNCVTEIELNADSLRGVLWVDEKTGDFVVAWFFDTPAHYLCFCKKGDNSYTVIPLYEQVPKLINGLDDVVLRGYRLYIASARRYVRVIDLSGQEGFQDVTGIKPKAMISPLIYHQWFSIAVTTAGDVLSVESTTFGNHLDFRVYKKDPNAHPDGCLVEVDSLGDEALLLDVGITVPSNLTLGIKPNCIYFTRHDRARHHFPFDLDICVFNLANKSLQRFPTLAENLNLKLKDARWVLPLMT